MPSSLIQWESHGHKKLSHGFAGYQRIATIHKHKNHTHTNQGNYSVEVLGTELPTRFRGIAEARAAAQAAYDNGHDSPRG